MLRQAAKCKTARKFATERGAKTCFGLQEVKSGAEFMYFKSNCPVCLRAVLRKENVGTKSDTLLAGCNSRSHLVHRLDEVRQRADAL